MLAYLANISRESENAVSRFPHFRLSAPSGKWRRIQVPRNV